MGQSDMPASRAQWIDDAVAQYGDALTRYATRLLGDADRARDVVQEAFVRLCRQDMAALDGRVGPWLFTVCRNRALDIRRREKRVVNVGDAPLAGESDDRPGPADSAARAETAGRVLALLSDLTERQQEVVRLKFQEGMSYRQIARVTGLTVSNVGFLIHTAVKTLRARLKEA